MSHARRAVRTRPSTPLQREPSGRVIGTVQRACSGCGHLLGNATDAELWEAVAGAGLSDTTAEHGCTWRPA